MLPTLPTLLHTADELRARARTGPRAVAMTMGALHEGHATLIRAARQLADAPARAGAQVGRDGEPGGGRAHGRGEVVVTVFVNPLQFGAGEDLDRYPRTLEADLKIAEAAGADVVFAPSVDEVYPGGRPQVGIAAGPMGERLEGASRPGHFDGMLTVVAKLLHLTDADAALFGQKDAQQLALVRRMVADLNFGVDVVAVPTVREDDGLALSSRNRYLSPAERRTALALSQALFAGRDRHAAHTGQDANAAHTGQDPNAAEGARPVGGRQGLPGAVLEAARGVLEQAATLRPPLELDYVALVDPSDFTDVAADHTGDAVLAVAAKVGATRLIDNLPLTFEPTGAAT